MYEAKDTVDSLTVLEMFLCAVLILIQGAYSSQACLLASNGERPLPKFVRPGSNEVPRFRDNPIQAIITSYRFNCCGVVTEWRAFVHGSGVIYFRMQPYTISFQVWRPNSPSLEDTDGCYTMAGVNHFSPIPLADPQGPDRGVVTGRPVESERIEVQPGDVVGFYLERTLSVFTGGDGIQFARDSDNTSPYTNEIVWFATDSMDSGNLTCRLPVGASGVFTMSTNLAPLITATVLMSDCSVSPTIIPSTTSHISTPNPTPSTQSSPPSHEVPTPTPTPPSQELSSLSPPSPTSHEVPTSISPSEESYNPTSSSLPSHESAPTPTLSLLPNPSPPSLTLQTSSQVIPGLEVDNIRLYVGTAAPVGVLVVGIVLVILIVVYVITKVRTKRALTEGSEMVYYSAPSLNIGQSEQDTGPYYSAVESEIGPASRETEVCSESGTNIMLFENNYESDPSNRTSQNPAYDYISTTTDDDTDYYVNEGLDESCIKMTKNAAYSNSNECIDLPIPTEGVSEIERATKLDEADIATSISEDISSVPSNPISQNPLHGCNPTLVDDDLYYYSNEGLYKPDMKTIKNSKLNLRLPNSDIDFTTDGEVHTSLEPDYEELDVEESYDYVYDSEL